MYFYLRENGHLLGQLLAPPRGLVHNSMVHIYED